MAFDVYADGNQWFNYTITVGWTGCSASGTTTIFIGGPGNIDHHIFSFNNKDTAGNGVEFQGAFTSNTTASGTFNIANYFVCVPKWYGCCWYGISDHGAWTASGPARITIRNIFLPMITR